jgi:RNA polymerase sigma-70 factor (ECF subfamily)
MPEPSPDLTQMLEKWGDGDEDALNALFPIVYAELRRQAARHFRRERAGHTLQPTALIHEAYVRLIDQRRVRWQNRAHFFAVAAQLMRRILVDHARGRLRAKRGGTAAHVTLDDALALATNGLDLDALALDDALTRLAALEPRQSRVVELRYFSGLSIEETAAVLGVSPATVKHDWSISRAWLRREMRGSGAP